MNESAFYFFVSFFLLCNLFSLFPEQNILFLAHLWISEKILVHKIVSLERALESKALMMFKYTSSLHSIFLPVSIIAISILPLHFAMLMISSFLKCAFVDKLSWNSEFSLSLFSISIPISLHIKLFTSYFDGF